jgi:hypothetical protein
MKTRKSHAIDKEVNLVEAPAQINALISTTRQEIVDTLQAMTEASVPELARQLARPADALYYHVRALLKAGLLRQVGSRQVGKHVEALYATQEPEKRLKLRYQQGNAAATESLKQLVASMLRASGREFDRAIGEPNCQLEGPQRELWAGRAKGWVSPLDLQRINALLAELTQLLFLAPDAKRNRLFSLQFLLAPAAVREIPPSTISRKPRTRSKP